MFKPQRINELMIERKLLNKSFTKTELLKTINLTAPALKNILNGDSLPRIDTIEKLATFFKVDMNYFFDQYESTVRTSEMNSCWKQPPEYGSENPWKICFEQQKEITELKVELEGFRKNPCATGTDAKTG